jgi:hypothetical protein
VDAEVLFRLLNLAVLPWWVVWIAAPRSARAARLASHSAVWLVLCAIYALLLLSLLLGGGLGGGLDYDSLRIALATRTGFLAGWTHYLAFDLFVGAWILRESLRLDVEVRPYLVLTLLAGPLGLGAFLLRRALRLRTLGQLGDSDLA